MVPVITEYVLSDCSQRDHLIYHVSRIQADRTTVRLSPEAKGSAVSWVRFYRRLQIRAFSSVYELATRIRVSPSKITANFSETLLSTDAQRRLRGLRIRPRVVVVVISPHGSHLSSLFWSQTFLESTVSGTEVYQEAECVLPPRYLIMSRSNPLAKDDITQTATR